MKRVRVDFLVVGAGLAGSVTGFLLKEAGADVLALELLDAKTKDKLCGGMMSPNVFEFFVQVFGEGCKDILHPMLVQTFCQRYAGREIQSESTICTLPRKRLDDYCLERYLQAGGRLKDRTTVRGIDDSDGVAVCADLRTGETFEIEFDRIIGADGAMSAVRRLLTGKNQQVGITLEGVAPLRSRACIFEYITGDLGYSWYIPRGEDAVVGVGCLNGNAATCREHMEAFCRELQIEAPHPVRGAAIPAGNDVLLEYGKRAFFAGDAAGLISGASGAGIGHAVESARLLAKSLLNGSSYIKSMESRTDYIADLAATAKKTQFFLKFCIMRKGESARPLTFLQQ